MTMTATQTKRCTACGRALPLDAFGKIRKDRPWLRSKCNACESARISNYRKEARRG